MDNEIKFEQLKNAKKGTPWANAYEFICKKMDVYKACLDKNFYSTLETGEWLDRYNELIFYSLLAENCGAIIMKPPAKKNTACHDLDVSIGNTNFSLEIVNINNTQGLDHIPNDLIEGDSSRSPQQIQLRIANALSNKTACHAKYLKAGNLEVNRPFVLGIGLYGLPHALAKKRLFLDMPVSYLGAFFPVEHMRLHLAITSNTAGHQAEVIKVDATYNENNSKKSVADGVEKSVLVSKNIFLNPEYSFISAVVISGVSDEPILSGHNSCQQLFNDLILVHNPNAINPLPQGIIPVLKEHYCAINEDHVKLDIVS